jgi:hypothetical protein
MISFKQYIKEVLDKPLKWKEFIDRGNTRLASFDVGKFGYVITVTLGNKIIAKRMGEKIKMSVEFTLGSESGVSKQQGKIHNIIKTGNAGVVFATVIDYVKYIIKQENVGTVLFSGKEQSRQKLYWAILKRMSRLGIVKGGLEKDGTQFVAHIDKVK